MGTGNITEQIQLDQVYFKQRIPRNVLVAAGSGMAPR